MVTYKARLKSSSETSESAEAIASGAREIKLETGFLDATRATVCDCPTV
jgi:hypothetical protein